MKETRTESRRVAARKQGLPDQLVYVNPFATSYYQRLCVPTLGL